MKKEWKDIEGYKVRIDVGSSLSEAMSSSMGAAIICFTTDGHIVLNGLSYVVSTTEFESLKTDVESFGQIASENQQSIRTLTDDVDTLKIQMEDSINSFGELQENDKKQDKRLDELESLKNPVSNAYMQTTKENSFFVCDNEGNIVLKYGEDGFDAAMVTRHFVDSVCGAAQSPTSLLESKKVKENGLYFIDESLNIGVAIDGNGLHAINIIEYEND